jgi:hypothetical protein
MNFRHRQHRRPHGLTLTELLIAGTILTMLAAGMGSLVMAVHATNEFCRGQAVAAQHARVTLDRIERSVRLAKANAEFPGCMVIMETLGGYEFPDTLVVWDTDSAITPPTRKPKVNELKIFCPDPTIPGKLIEIRAPSDTSECPAASNEAAWATLVDGIKAGASSEAIELTDRLRTATAGGAGSGELRGCVRFERKMSPSTAQWTEYRGGTRTWKAIDWPLDYYSTQTGMRRVVCQTELQITPGNAATDQTAAPFFGSATLTYELSR